MPTAEVDHAIDVVVAAIAGRANRAAAHDLTALATALFALTTLKVVRSDTAGPAQHPQDMQSGHPRVTDFDRGATDRLEALPEGAAVVVDEQETGMNYWQKLDGLWWTLGSAAGYRSDELAIRGDVYHAYVVHTRDRL